MVFAASLAVAAIAWAIPFTASMVWSYWASGLWCAIAIGITFVPLVLMPFVTEGPFAVNGMWNFFFIFTIWLFAFQIPIGYYMLKEVMGHKRVARQVLSHAN